jgi:hypothetical protein
MPNFRPIFFGLWALLTAPVVCGLPVFLFTLLTQYVAIASWGSELLFSLLMLALGVPLLMALGLGLIACITIFIPTARRHAPMFFFCAVACFAAMKGGAVLGDHFRQRKCVQLAEIGRPLVQAVQAYERKYDSPPPSLEALVPEFLPLLPKTGVGASPSFEYIVGDYAAYYGQAWTICVYIPCNVLEYDTFYYAPSVTASPGMNERAVERIGDWGYLYAD